MGDISLSDIAALLKNDDGFGGSNGILWVLVLIVLLGGFGNGWGNGGNSVLDSTLAASAAQGGYVTSDQLNDALRLQAIQSGQSDIKGDVNAIEQRLTASLSDLKANQASNFQQQQTCCAEIKANDTANTQKVLDRLNQMESAWSAQQLADRDRRISQLETKNAIDQATAGVVRYPNTFAYNAGQNPFCGCCA